MRLPDKPAAKIAYISLLVCLAILLGYVELLIPINIGVPGIKLGLANIAVLFALYSIGRSAALYVTAGRQLLSALLFGNSMSLLFSISGAILSLIVMTFSKRLKCFSIIGVSALGGVAHNTAQIAAACIIMRNVRIFYYLPFLLISGIFFGALNGIIISRVLKKIDGKQ